MPSMKTRKYARYDDGAANILETIIAIGISIALLTIFFISANNLYNIYDRSEVDLKAKSIGILEQLVNSPGKIGSYGLIWEDDPLNASTIGLSTSPTVAYGVVYVNSKGESTVLSRYDFQGDMGLETCFLAGTKVLMADGSHKNIEDVMVGDLVRSYNKDNVFVASKVTNVFHHSPEEMTDYYLVINNQLRVTPNHRFYSDGKWVYAGDLKVGDSLFNPSCNVPIYSLEKVFEKCQTYDLEVDICHNYFVAMDTIDILVHNANPAYPPVPEDPVVHDQQQEQGNPLHQIPWNYDPPSATFVWFDKDGLGGGTEILFDASASTCDGDPWYSWWFDWGGTNIYYPPSRSPIALYDLVNDNSYKVRLKVNDTWGWCNYTCTVQANTISTPSTEPETETYYVYPGIDNKTLAPYDERYYVKYTLLEGNYYMYEIKSKINPMPRAILDLEKIDNLPPGGNGYFLTKSCLGLDKSEYIGYNFNIKINGSTTNTQYGASFEEENFTSASSTTREVLIYHNPTFTKPNGDYNLTQLPSYESGRITVSVFLGGEEPNAAPDPPNSPIPSLGKDDVAWYEDLSWSCRDRNYDPLKYDVYFGTSTSPPKVVSNQSGTTYDPPGTMNHATTYYWKIVAWDSKEAHTDGPVWFFTTHGNSKPNAPSSPSPATASTDVCVTPTLSWTGGDPDISYGDSVKYDVYFGTTSSPPKVVSNQSSTTYTPSMIRLDYNTTYYWKIVARDSWGQTEPGSIWSFTTAKKGLDQVNKYGSNLGLNTLKIDLGQTFTAGRTGNLTSIDLSLKFMSGTPPEDIQVQIRDNSTYNNILASGTIKGFGGAGESVFLWKTVTFGQPLYVYDKQPYFIVVNTSKTTYAWQYSSPSGSNYEGGSAWQYSDTEHAWKNPGGDVSDFLFKTYVIKSEIDQSCLEIDPPLKESIGSGLAQTFRVGIIGADPSTKVGDLMKVALSLSGSSSLDITVKIYEGVPSGIGHGVSQPKATTTIKGFDSHGKFVWKEANFTNIAYLESDKSYYIEISSAGSYDWEKQDKVDYLPGDAWKNDIINGWKPIDPKTDFIFKTYMSPIDSCR